MVNAGGEESRMNRTARKPHSSSISHILHHRLIHLRLRKLDSIKTDTPRTRKMSRASLTINAKNFSLFGHGRLQFNQQILCLYKYRSRSVPITCHMVLPTQPRAHASFIGPQASCITGSPVLLEVSPTVMIAKKAPDHH